MILRRVFFAGFLLFGSFVLAAPAEATYYKQGTALSANMLSGATSVTAIASVTVTATLPVNTTAKIKYSQNNVNFYNAAGTSEGYDTIAAGTNTIDISARGWSGSIFYYKIELGTTDSAATPVVSDVQVNYTGSATPAPGATRYQYQGTLLSTNVLSGTSNVTAINSVTVTATLPGGSTVGIKYSQDNVHFYNAAGTAEAYDTVAAGTNAISVAPLGWTGGIFYYKLQWTSIDNWTTPTVSDVTVDYTGDVASSPNCSAHCYLQGAFVSTNLMTNIGHSMRGTEYFSYAISNLPGGSSVTAQFSQDGTNWYSASGTLWGATTLSSGEHTKYATALSLATLNWKDGTSFYYKLNLATTDNTQVPVISHAGLLFAQMTYLNASQNDSMTNGLVGLWSFNGDDISGTTAYDRSGQGNNGTLTNGPTKVAGKVGQGLSFDGTNDYVAVADNSVLDVGSTADLTLSGWFYRDTFTTDDTIIAKRNGIAAGDIGYLAYIDDATDQLIFEVSDGVDEYSLTSTSTFASTGWNHYTIVWDQDSAANSEIYINGVANSATDSGTIGNIGDLSNALVLAEGAESDAGNPFDGKLDEVRVYNRAISATEIQSLYALGQSDKVNSSVSQPQGTGRLDSGLAGYWKMDNGSGTSATDSSTNGNNGTLTSGPTWTTGKIGSAVNFDGVNDVIKISPNSAINNLANITISAWIAPGINDNKFIFGGINGEEGSTNNYIMIDNAGAELNNPKISAYISIGGTFSGVSDSFASPTNDWIHIVYTYDGSSEKLYHNGILGTTVVKSGTLSGNTEAGLVIGDKYQFVAQAGSYFIGSIDDVRVYNRTLSADEVGQLYRLTTPTGVDTSLKGYWSFNGQDISGTTAYDRSGAGNNGTLTNGPTKKPGKLGQAVNFDGVNDLVTAGTNVNITGAITLATWAKTASTGSQYFVSNRNGSTGYAFLMMGSADTYKLRFTYFGVQDINSAVSAYSADNQWHYYAVTNDLTNTKFYVDGVLFSTTGAVSGISSVGTLEIGECTSVSNTNFNGSLDEVRIYNRALSATEIAALYNQSR